MQTDLELLKELIRAEHCSTFLRHSVMNEEDLEETAKLFLDKVVVPFQNLRFLHDRRKTFRPAEQPVQSFKSDGLLTYNATTGDNDNARP